MGIENGVEPETGGAKHELAGMLSYAITHDPKGVEFIPINYVLDSTARQNDKRPALIVMYTPDEWVKNLNGKENLMDGYIAVRVPRETVEKFINGQH